MGLLPGGREVVIVISQGNPPVARGEVRAHQHQKFFRRCFQIGTLLFFLRDTDSRPASGWVRVFGTIQGLSDNRAGPHGAKDFHFITPFRRILS